MPRERDNVVSKATKDSDVMKAANAAALAAVSNKKPTALELLKQAEARQKELDALAAAAKSGAAKTIAELQSIVETGGDPLRNPSKKPTPPEGYDFNWDGTSWKLTEKTVTPTGVVKQPTVVQQPTGTDAATLSLIKSLQDQITNLTNQQTAAANIAAANAAKAAESQRKSIIATLTDRFNKYGLGSLANKVRELAIDGATEATITLALQETPEYQQRFAANAERLKKNLQVLSPAEYINLEDSYRQVLRAYGLRQFDTDDYVRQFIANDMSAAELSDRVVTAVQRVQNADPATARTLRDYYGISNADLVAYVLDPNQQLQKIQRQVAAAEIGAAARVQGLEAGVSVAEQLASQGVTQAQAQKGYATIADILPTAEKLSQIYGNTMAGYGQAEAEQEVFNSLAEAQKKRERLTARELAAFSGQSGLSRVALTQGTQGQFQNP